MKSQRNLILLLITWGISLFLINPIGEFPLNDDWAYAEAVKRFVETGAYAINDWPAMTLLTHILWGSLFCWIFGFSFTVLRMANLIAAVGVAILFYRLLKKLNASEKIALIATALLLFNPLFYSLSNTFMTDITFLFLVLWSCFYYKKGIDQAQSKAWWMAIGISIIAVLLRQFALLLPLAFGGILILRYRNWQALAKVAGGILLCAISLKTYTYLLDIGPGIPAAYSSPIIILERFTHIEVLSKMIVWAGAYLLYAGVFFLPLLLLLRLPDVKQHSLVWIASSLLAGVLLYFGWDAIFLENILYNFGIGPITLIDDMKNQLSDYQLSPPYLVLLKCLAGIGLFLMLLHILAGVSKLKTYLPSNGNIGWFKLGITFYVGAYFVFMLVNYVNFDRYLLQLLPFGLLLLTGLPTRFVPLNIIPSALLFILLLYFTVAGTHDYLAWNKTRWNALYQLMDQEQVPPEKIDGGFEFNGWYNTYPRNPSTDLSKNWWFVNEDEWVAAFQNYPCFTIQSSHYYNRWLSFGQDTVHLLKRPAFDTLGVYRNSMEQLDSTEQFYLDELDPSRIYNKGGFTVQEPTRTGQTAIKLENGEDFFGKTTLVGIQACDQITITFWKKGLHNSIGVVTASPDHKELYSYTTFVDQIHEGAWDKVRAELTVPADYTNSLLEIYIWKWKADASVIIDDMEIVWRGAR